MNRWKFSLILGIIYLISFHLWMWLDRTAIVASTLILTALATGLMLAANKKSYFLNVWDRFFHAAVIADILLEGLLIPTHDNYGFYLCAIAFAIVLGGYRLKKLGRSSRQLKSNAG